jgi:opacity protein-like surface antigen
MISFVRLTTLALALAPTLALAQAPAGSPAAPPPEMTPPPQGPAFAPTASSVGRPYVALRGGLASPQHDDLQGMESGLSIEGAVGYRANPNIALEFSVGRWSMTGDETINGTKFSLELVGYPVLATGKLILPLDKVELYALAGGGLHFITANASMSGGGFNLSGSDSSSAFAFHVGGGADLALSPTAALGVEVKYVIGSTDVSGVTLNFDHLVAAASLKFTL